MKKILFVTLILVAIGVAACSPGLIEKNPAAQDCEANGGRVELRTENGQSAGYCVFPDGTQCSETDYAEGTCAYQQEEASGIANPASVYCEEQGGTLEMRTDDQGGVAGYCVFEDGSECDEWSHFRGECYPESQAYMNPVPENAMSGNAFVNTSELKLAGELTVVLQGDLPDPCNSLHIEIQAPDSDNRINVIASSWYEDNGLACVQVLEPFEVSVRIPTQSLADGIYTVLVNGEEIGSFQSTN